MCGSSFSCSASSDTSGVSSCAELLLFTGSSAPAASACGAAEGSDASCVTDTEPLSAPVLPLCATVPDPLPSSIPDDVPALSTAPDGVPPLSCTDCVVPAPDVPVLSSAYTGAAAVRNTAAITAANPLVTRCLFFMLFFSAPCCSSSCQRLPVRKPAASQSIHCFIHSLPIWLLKVLFATH